MSSQGRALEMIAVQEEIRSSALAYFGPTDRHTLTATGNLGSSYLQVGRIEEAGDMLELALEGRRRTLDEDHPEIADTLSLLGQLHGMRGDMATAETLFGEAHRISSLARGPSHPLSIAHLRSQAVAVRNQGRFDEALVLFSQAKRLTTGSEATRTELRILEQSLIICYLQAGRLPDAEEEARKLLEACVDDSHALADAHQFLMDQDLETP